MTESSINKLFVDFESLAEGNPTGTGLGLSICKQLIQKMDGIVKVKSKVGKGTTFKIELIVLCSL